MKKIFIVTILSVLTLSGCSDFLVQPPTLSQSTELTLSDYNGLDKAVAGAYSPLASSTWYGAYLVLDGEMRAGNAKIPTSADFQSGRMRDVYTMNYNENTTTSLWGYAYLVISQVNNVINNLEGKESDVVSAQDINNIKAEALFLRALSHFDLVRTYSQAYSKGADGMGVPVILVTDATGTEQPARNTIKEVYTQVIADLVEAESIIDPSYVRAGTDSKAFVTVDAIRALLSRVYLNAKMWQEAADYATKVINSSNYTMWSAEQAADAAGTWGVDIPNSGEVIFEIYGIKANSYDGYWEGPSHMTNPIGYADCAASSDLVNLYADGDVRGSLFRTDPDEASNGEMWTTKYYGKGIGDALSTPDVNNVILLRLSEMYLTRAEAIVEGASIQGVTAVSDLNTIAANRNVELYVSVGREDVFQERRKELAFEGHYWYDLARSGKTLSYSDAAISNRTLAPDAALWA